MVEKGNWTRKLWVSDERTVILLKQTNCVCHTYGIAKTLLAFSSIQISSVNRWDTLSAEYLILLMLKLQRQLEKTAAVNYYKYIPYCKIKSHTPFSCVESMVLQRYFSIITSSSELGIPSFGMATASQQSKDSVMEGICRIQYSRENYILYQWHNISWPCQKN